ncbi:hypothetical protein H4R27_004942, partial [Coemansia aciculifera]
MNSPDRPATSIQLAKNTNTLAGESFSFSTIPGTRYNDVELLLQNTLHRNCDAVRKLATPCDPSVSTMACKLTENIDADLEVRLSMMTRCRKSYTYSWGKTYHTYPQRGRNYIDPLDSWTIDILEWTGCSEPNGMRADYIVPCSDAFLLFVAHHIKAYLSERVVAGLLKPEDCRLILPVANEDTKAKRASIYPAGYWDYKAFAHAECCMFPLSSGIERQVAPTPHAIVANVEIVADSDGLDEAVQLLTAITTELFAGQHNRRFAWGLTTSSRTIHAYIFGPDDIWSSTEMDITSAEGRLAFISLLVYWSLCSVDGLRLDPTIRYVIDGSVGDPHLEIDVHEMDE